MSIEAIVLLGYRDSGKDSVFKALSKKLSKVVNVKFGAFNKSIVASLLEVPESWMEDKAWRTEEWSYGITPLELLDALFLYSETSEKFQQNIDRITFASIPDGRIPVFTDIRRERELDKVYEKFRFTRTKVFSLGGENTGEFGDQFLGELIAGHTDEEIETGLSFDEVADKIIDSCGFKVEMLKPTLHIFNAGYTYPHLRQLATYEPLTPLLNKVKATVKDYGLGNEAVAKLFNLIYSESPKDKLELADIIEDSVMTYVHSQHRDFIPELREKANLLYYIKRGSTLSFAETDTFHIYEIKTYE